MTTPFAVTWDYRCPFARNAHEHIVAALEAGADWDVTWLSFSLSQVHVEEGQPDVWDDPGKAATLRAPEAAVVVRERYPDAFAAVHIGLFAARHDEGRDIREDAVVRAVLEDAGVDAAAVFDEIDQGWPLETLRKEHEGAAADHGVFGVPTFIVDGQAVFVRLMDRPRGDAERGRSSIQRVLELATGSPELNELKHTRIPR